ncbi:hypothetical protein L8Q94_22445, partial [Enterobacter kobei]|uniref:hypothetical protein n=1 Tax=Enterobacter kobei TaxID=208224 RepID=UPI00200594B2
GIPLSEGISAAAGIVNLRYKSCPEMEGQDQKLRKAFSTFKSRHNGDVSTEQFDKWCTKRKLSEQQVEMLRGMIK